MKYRRLLHLALLIVIPLHAHIPGKMSQKLPYLKHNQRRVLSSEEFDWQAELRRIHTQRDKLDRELKLEKGNKSSWFDTMVRAVLLGLCGWLAWKNRYELIAFLIGGEVFLRHQIMVGHSPCQGREVRISDTATLKQVLVARQGGATCGAHAFKNAALTIDALDHNDNNLGQRLCDEILVELLLKKRSGAEAEGTWREVIRQHRQDNAEGRDPNEDWLDEGDIQAIRDYEARYHSATQASFNSDRISVCSNHRLLGGIEHYAQPHGFVLGDMPLDGGSAGHWIAVVLHQQDDRNREYIVADSMNGLAWRGHQGIEQLRRALEPRE